MSSRIHPQARTTPKIRQEIKDSCLLDRQAAKVFNISRATARKWLKRDDVQGRSHRAHTLHTTLSAAQEAIVLAPRQSLYLPLDDLLFVTRQHINPDVSRSGIARLLKREGMCRLEDVIPKAESETIAPQEDLQGLRARLYPHRYQVSAADAGRDFAPLRVRRHRSCHALGLHAHLRRHYREQQRRFPATPEVASPIKISKILTDNGSQFADRFAATDKKPGGQHAYDLACAALPAELRLAPPRHLQTNGMVERSTAASTNCCS